MALSGVVYTLADQLKMAMVVVVLQQLLLSLRCPPPLALKQLKQLKKQMAAAVAVAVVMQIPKDRYHPRTAVQEMEVMVTMWLWHRPHLHRSVRLRQHQ